MALTKKASQQASLKDVLCFVQRLNEGALEVVAGPIDADDDDEVEMAILAVIEMDGWDDNDRYFLTFLGEKWTETEELSSPYLAELKEEALENLEGDK